MTTTEQPTPRCGNLLSDMSDPTRAILAEPVSGFTTEGNVIWPSGILTFAGPISATVVTATVSLFPAALYLSGGMTTPISTKTDNYTATSADYTLLFNIATAKTLTLPAAASNSGRVYFVKNKTTSADTLTIDPNGAELIDGAANYPVAVGLAAIIHCDGIGWQIISALA